MCIFGGGSSQPEPMQTYKPPESRVIQQNNPLAKAKKVSDDDGSNVEIAYGGEQTRSTPAAGKKRGPGALKIALNQPSAGANTGGISNV